MTHTHNDRLRITYAAIKENEKIIQDFNRYLEEMDFRIKLKKIIKNG